MTAFTPLLAGALEFAFKMATTEGKITIGALVIVSLFSWTVIITKLRQIMRARKMSRKFFAAYYRTKEALDLHRKKEVFDGAPGYEVYQTGIEELNYHLERNPVKYRGEYRISQGSFDTVKVAMERMVSAQGMALEKGMIVLSTAVAGGPFIGLLGTVWGVMDTFSGVAKANVATLSVMAPGVAGALIATVIGLLVAIPAMFAYNFMVTTIRNITQELDNFTAEFATHIEHQCVDNRPLGEEVAAALDRILTQKRLIPSASDPQEALAL